MIYALKEIVMVADPQIRDIHEDTLSKIVDEFRREARSSSGKDLLVAELLKSVLNKMMGNHL